MAAVRLLLTTPRMVVGGCPVGPYGMNQYVVGCLKTGRAALIDCGEPDHKPFSDFAKKEGLKLEAVYTTHGHIDHILGMSAIKEQLNLPIYMHEKDIKIYNNLPLMAKAIGLYADPAPTPDKWIHDGDTLELGDLNFKVLHTPGHSPGHVCFHEEMDKVLFCGDLLFAGSIGRTDLPGANMNDMLTSLQKVVALDKETICFAGHMGSTTIGKELKSNPFMDMVFDHTPSTSSKL
eukprot:m.341824 g.341824  ORF g.341824 m.341824 type:complete len:234 (+) comp20556_c0_seq1:237-938(+)